MAQFLRPSSDVTTTNWTRSSGTNAYYTYIDETTASSADYVQTQSQGSDLEVGLSTVDDPVSSADHIVRVQVWSLGSGGPERHTIILLEGGTTIATVVSTGSLPRNSPTEITYTLSGAEADSITDYSDLRLRFTPTSLGGSETYRVGWAEMEVPDAPPPVTTRYILVT